MHCRLLVSLAAVAAVSSSLAFTQDTKTKPVVVPPSKPTLPTKAPEMPEGMDPADMQAFMEAAMPGPMHAHLMKGVGVWDGKTKSWMAPDAPPTEGTCVSTVTSVVEGKFTKAEIKGDMPGMGAFIGMGINGYDNVSKQFQSTWLDNMGTGMMQGTGSLSADGKVLTWNFNYHCPITKKACVMREIETFTGPNSMTLEMFGPHPKTGKEFKMMEIAFSRKAGTGSSSTATATER